MVISFLNLVILLRTSRLTMFLGELVVWKNFIRSLKALTKPFINLTVTMYSLLLLYSAIGGHLFGGVINTNSIDTEEAINISDNQDSADGLCVDCGSCDICDELGKRWKR